MEPLFINGTANTPSISFEPHLGIFDITGNSRQSDSDEFYNHLKSYLQQYQVTPCKQTIFKITFEEFDNYSLNKLYELLGIFELIHNAGNKVFVYWCYENRDDKLIEISKNLDSNFSFTFKAIESVF